MEIYISVMAGCVLGLFLIVGEIALLRKRVPAILAYLGRMRQSGKTAKFVVAVSGIAAFFLIQPVIVGVLVALAVNNLDPHFAANLLHRLNP